MSIVYFTGFDKYGTSTGPSGSIGNMVMDGWELYTTDSTTYNSIVCVSSSERSGNVLKLDNGYAAGGTAYEYIEKRLYSNYSSIGISLSVLHDQDVFSQDKRFICFLDASTIKIYFFLDSLFRLNIANGNGTIIGTSSRNIVAPNTWFHIESKIVFHNTNGSVIVRLNGNPIPIINVSNVNTSPTGNNYTNKFRFEHGNNNGLFSVDDLVIWDTNGTENNDFLGPVISKTLYPNGDSGTNTMIPDSGLNLYSRINQNSPDGDSSYVSANNINEELNCTLDDLSEDVTNVLAISPFIITRKTSYPITSISYGINSTLDQTIINDSSYQSYSYIKEIDPDTSSHYTKTKINSSTIYIKRI